MSDPTVLDYMGKNRSATIGTITDLDAPERDIQLRVAIDPYSTEPKVEFREKLPSGKSATQRLYFGGLTLGKTAAQVVAMVTEYLNLELPEGAKGWKVEALPLKKKGARKSAKKKPTEHRELRELREKRARLQKARFKTWNDEQEIEHINRILAADAGKWKSGMGVGWKVTRDQINRGFRIVAVLDAEKRADIVQVADTGLTHTGGDDPLSGEMQRVWLADLIRDKKYDAPPTTGGFMEAPPAGFEPQQILPTEPGWTVATSLDRFRRLVRKLSPKVAVRCALPAVEQAVAAFYPNLADAPAEVQAGLPLVRRWLAGDPAPREEVLKVYQAAIDRYRSGVRYAVIGPVWAVSQLLAEMLGEGQGRVAWAVFAAADAWSVAKHPGTTEEVQRDARSQFIERWWSECRRLTPIRDPQLADVETTRGPGSEEEYMQLTDALHQPPPMILSDLRVREMLHAHSARETSWPSPGSELFDYAPQHPTFRANLTPYLRHVLPSDSFDVAVEAAQDLVWHRVPEFIFRLADDHPIEDTGRRAGLDASLSGMLDSLVAWVRPDTPSGSLVFPGWGPRQLHMLIPLALAEAAESPEAAARVRRALWAAAVPVMRRPWDKLTLPRVADVLQTAILSELGTIPFPANEDLAELGDQHLGRVGAARRGRSAEEAAREQPVVLAFLHRWWERLRARYPVATIYRNENLRVLVDQLTPVERATALAVAVQLLNEPSPDEVDPELRQLKPELSEALRQQIDLWLRGVRAGAQVRTDGAAMCATVTLGIFEAAAWEPRSWLLMSASCLVFLANELNREMNPVDRRRDEQQSRSVFLYGMGAALIAATDRKLTPDAIKMRTDPFLPKEVEWLRTWWRAVAQQMPDTAQRIENLTYSPAPTTVEGPPHRDELLESVIGSRTTQGVIPEDFAALHERLDNPAQQRIEPMSLLRPPATYEDTTLLFSPEAVMRRLHAYSPSIQHFATLMLLQRAWAHLDQQLPRPTDAGFRADDPERDILLETAVSEGLAYIERALRLAWPDPSERQEKLREGLERFPGLEPIHGAQHQRQPVGTLIPAVRQIYMGMRLLLAEMAGVQLDTHGNQLMRAFPAAMRGALTRASQGYRFQLPDVHDITRFYREWLAEVEQRFAIKDAGSATVSGDIPEWTRLHEHLQHPPSRVLTPTGMQDILLPKTTTETPFTSRPSGWLFPAPERRTAAEDLQRRVREWVDHFVGDEWLSLMGDLATTDVWHHLAHWINELDQAHPRDEEGRMGMSFETAHHLDVLNRWLRQTPIPPSDTPEWTFSLQRRLETLSEGYEQEPLVRRALWAGRTALIYVGSDGPRDRLAGKIRAAIASVVGEEYQTLPAPEIREPSVPEAQAEAMALKLMDHLSRAYRSRVAIFEAGYTLRHLARLLALLPEERKARAIAVAARMVRRVPADGGYVISEVMGAEEYEGIYAAIDAWLEQDDYAPASQYEWLGNIVLRGVQEYRKWDPRLWVAFSAVWMINHPASRTESRHVANLAILAALRGGVTREPALPEEGVSSRSNRLTAPELRWVQAWWSQLQPLVGTLWENIEDLPGGPSPNVGGLTVAGEEGGAFEEMGIPFSLPPGVSRSEMTPQQMVQVINELLGYRGPGTGRWGLKPVERNIFALFNSPLIRLEDVLTDRALVQAELALLDVVDEIAPAIEYAEGPRTVTQVLLRAFPVIEQADPEIRPKYLPSLRHQALTFEGLTPYHLEVVSHEAGRIMYAARRTAEDMADYLEGRKPNWLMSVFQDTMIAATMGLLYDTAEDFADAWWAKLEQRLLEG